MYKKYIWYCCNKCYLSNGKNQDINDARECDGVMKFTYDAYRGLIHLLKEKEYVFTDYHGYEKYQKCVILRHDIDYNLQAALPMARIEADEGVKSTYFVLLRTDFYNPASFNGVQTLKKIQALGHEIGLHFDEAACEDKDIDVCTLIQKEAEILSDICQTRICTVSMHRPSLKTLERNYEIQGIVNTYGETFFKKFKYVSDSRRNWREPVRDIVLNGNYDRMHILTHAFWYRDEEETLEATISKFVRSANKERYDMLSDNIRDLQAIMTENEI